MLCCSKHNLKKSNDFFLTFLIFFIDFNVSKSSMRIYGKQKIKDFNKLNFTSDAQCI